MEEKNSMSKVIFTVFVIILVAFLFFHFYKVNSLEKQYQSTVKTVNTQLAQANKEIEMLQGEIKFLRYKLEIASIVNDVARNNFGIAQDKVDNLVKKLEAEHNKNIDQIKKIQENLHILFTKKNNNEIIAALGELEKTIGQ